MKMSKMTKLYDVLKHSDIIETELGGNMIRTQAPDGTIIEIYKDKREFNMCMRGDILVVSDPVLFTMMKSLDERRIRKEAEKVIDKILGSKKRLK